MPREFRLQRKEDCCLPGTLKGKKKKSSSLLEINVQFDLGFIPAMTSKTFFKIYGGNWHEIAERNATEYIFNA